MKSHQKRLVSQWENDVAAAAAAPPKRRRSSSSIRVCRHCQREFSNPRALGGHIRIHNGKQTQLSPARGHSSNNNNRRTNEAARARAARARARATRFKGGGAGNNDDESNNNEAVDLSQNMSEFGWKVHKKRSSSSNTTTTTNNNNNSDNNREKRKVEILVVCKCMEDEEEWDEGDDDGHSSVKERLQRIGISCTAHPIIMTRRRFFCTVCDHYMLTFHSVCCHVHEAHSDHNADTLKERNFDLNELPPIDDHHQQQD